MALLSGIGAAVGGSGAAFSGLGGGGGQSLPGRDDWFQQQGPPSGGGSWDDPPPPVGVAHDPTWQARYNEWQARNPGVTQQQWYAQHPYNQNPSNPTAPASAPPLQPGAGDAQTPQDPVAYFNSLIGNLPPSPASLVSLEPQLAQRGIKVLRNASGIAGKIQLPSGEIVDVGQSFGSGDPSAMRWQALQNDPKFHPEAAGPPGGGGPNYGMLSGGQGSLAGLAAGALQTSPGFQFRLAEGAKALERSAAAKGTLLTGGTLKGLTRYAQDYASNEYANQYARLFGEQGARYQQLFGLSNLGLSAAGQSAGTGTSYAGQAGNILGGQAGAGTDLITGGANAGAAGTIGAGNAWQQGLQGAGNAAQQAYLMWLMSGGGNTTQVPTLPGQQLPIPTAPR